MIIKNKFNILSIRFININTLFIPNKVTYLLFLCSIDTIIFTENHESQKEIKTTYSHFLSNIPLNVKTLVYDLNVDLYLKNKDIFTQLPNHIENLELIIYANNKEIFPHLNNLPFGLKLLKLTNIKYHTTQINLCKHKILIHDNNEILKNQFLLKHDIKLPFGCKIQLPDNSIHDNVENLFFKLIYNFPIFTSHPKTVSKKHLITFSKKSSKKSSEKSSKKSSKKYY